MAEARPQKMSQGTDMTEVLRYPDAIEYEQVIENCNILARPIASRTVCNKCYNLLWKVTYFSSSVYIGVRRVIETLDFVNHDRVLCLVMLAADAFIDAEMRMIVDTCKQRVIPYIFLPTKAGMQDALHYDYEVLALCIVFDHDPGMRREFEDCFVSIKSQCYKKKKLRSTVKCLASTSTSAMHEKVPRVEKPLQVTEAASSVERHIVSSESKWVTVSKDTESSNMGGDHPKREKSRDFSVNVPDESGSSFAEYVRIPSPTPAPPPSEMAAYQRREEPTTAAGSSEDSPRPGPSRVFLTPPKRHQQDSPHKQATWAISPPYAPVDTWDHNRVWKYPPEPSERNIRLRSRHSPNFFLEQYMLPTTCRQSASVEQQTTPQDQIDLDADEELTFQWTMEDLSSISNEQVVRQQQKPMSDLDLVNLISSSDDEVVEEASSNIQSEGAAGDGNICPIEDTSAPSSLPTTIDMTTESDGYPSFVEETKDDNAASTVALESSPSAIDLDNYYTDTSSTTVSIPSDISSFTSSILINLEPSSSNLFAFSDPPSLSSLLQLAPTDSGEPDDAAAASADQGNAPQVNAYPGGFGDEAAALPENMARQLFGEARDVPAVHAQFGELGDAAAGLPSASRAGDFGDAVINMPGTSRPSASGDAGIGDGNIWYFDMRPNETQNVPHQVTGTGEGPAFMPQNFGFIFAPRIIYMGAAGQDGRRRGAWNAPTEEDILNIPFPGEDQSSRSSNDPDLLSARTLSEADSGSYYDDDDEDEEVENVNPPTTPTDSKSEE